MKKRIKSKLVYAISGVVCFSLIFCLFTAEAYAKSEESSDTGYTLSESGEKAEYEDTEKAAIDINTAVASEKDVDICENIFESLYKLAGEYISEIMCALTLIGSLILTLLYKRGLMPFMTRTVGAIGSTIAGIKESTERYAELSGTELGEIKSAINSAEVTVGIVKTRLEAIEDTLKALGTDKSDREIFKAAIECQSTLLYEILMSSSIPQYQKDRVGEQLGAVKSAISSLDAGGNEK